MKKRLFLYWALLIVATANLSGCIWPFWYEDGGRGGGHRDEGHRDGGHRDGGGEHEERR